MGAGGRASSAPAAGSPGVLRLYLWPDHGPLDHERLANFLTVPALLPRARGEPCPPCVDFEVKWEPGSSTTACGNYTASHRAGVTTFTTRYQGPLLPPAPTSARPLGKQPRVDRSPLRYIHGTMETARFKYLRSGAGGSWSIPSIVALLHEMDDSPGHTASCLSWRTSGSLQQIFGLQTLVPAHPLTADSTLTPGYMLRRASFPLG